ncbi:hypothetical protein [Paenibacillus polymyxa]|uniref:hypothetical protein n=1 Tax=Paenibacillus polymyxa TaxID=1406 RepID=UPI0023791011|nr:hypothetical protein [Paenibacillus polymyxa]WDM20087.1 hypothetical protein J4I02_13395 [Paenibacillus polymyxa]
MKGTAREVKIMLLRMVAGCCSLLLLAGFLSGCNVISDPISLMETPTMSDEKQQLNGAVNTQLGAVQPLRPNDPDDPTPIRTGDLNNDGTDEAVLFYETPDESVKIHGALFEDQGGTWVKKLTFDGEGTVLESFKLVDLTNDGTLDIVAGFSSGDSGDGGDQKGLIVYSYTGGTLEKIYATGYTDFVVDDFKHNKMDLNGDNLNDLTIITLRRNEFFTVKTFQFSGGTFKEIGSLDLDSQVLSVYNVVAGKVAKGRQGIIIDTKIAQTTTVSNVIVMDHGKLRKLNLMDVTFKDATIASGDVDGDGILEFGNLEKPKGWSNKPLDEVPYFVSFYQWDGAKGTIFKQQQYRDSNEQVYFRLPKELHGKVTIDPKVSKKDSYLRFILDDTDKTIAEIKFFSLSQWERNNEGYSQLWRTNAQVIGIKRSSELEPRKTIKNKLGERQVE